jgi:AraC family transcriptional regulator
VSEFAVQCLLKTPIVTVSDVCCQGSHRQQSEEECATATQLVFPYRGVYMRHLGHDQAVAEANQVLFFNAHEGYRVSHPVPGGDASLTLVSTKRCCVNWRRHALFLRDDGAAPHFGGSVADRSAGPGARGAASAQPAPEHRRNRGSGKPRPDSRAAGPGAAHHAPPAPVSDGSGWWIASNSCWRAIRRDAGRWPKSPPKCAAPRFTSRRSFQQVEGLPLYRYQLRLRLARALDLLAQYDDLTALSGDLGFSSHSHFSAAFREAYGRSPSEFRQSALRR